MKVIVRSIFEPARLMGNQKVQDLEIPQGENLENALHSLCAKYGEKLRSLLFEENEVRGGITLFINGVQYLALGGLATVLQEGGEILILPPVGGG